MEGEGENRGREKEEEERTHHNLSQIELIVVSIFSATRIFGISPEGSSRAKVTTPRGKRKEREWREKGRTEEGEGEVEWTHHKLSHCCLYFQCGLNSRNIYGRIIEG
jgi:hypothetical protein